MNVTQLSQRVQFVVDAEGHKSAVLVSLDDWEHLLILLEDLYHVGLDAYNIGVFFAGFSPDAKTHNRHPSSAD